MADLAWIFIGRIQSMLTVLGGIPHKVTHTPQILNPARILGATVVTFGWVYFFLFTSFFW